MLLLDICKLLVLANLVFEEDTAFKLVLVFNLKVMVALILVLFLEVLQDGYCLILVNELVL